MTDKSSGAEQNILGRAREIAQLETGLSAAEGGRGQSFLVIGPAGIGKSWLANELERIAAGRGFLVLWGRCWESAGAPAFLPWRQIVGEALKLPFLASLAIDPASIDHLKSRFLHSSAEARTQGAGAGPEGSADRTSLFEMIADLFKAIASRHPILLILDDVHEADVESLRLAQYLIQEGIRSRLMLVASSRELVICANPPARVAIGQLQRAVSTIDLGGLGADALGALIAEFDGRAAEADLAAALASVTGGNPFFAKEILSLYARHGRSLSAGDLLPGALAVPESVRAVLRSKLDLLSGEARETLDQAAVMGRYLDVAILLRIRGVARESLVAHLEEASTLGLLSRSREAEPRLRFSHFLTAETLVADMSLATKQRLHGRIAEAIETQRSAADGARYSEIAFHHHASLPIGAFDKAYASANRAAAFAMQCLAYEEAARLYRMALDALEYGAETDPPSLCELLINLGQAECLAQEFDKYKATFVRAAEIARKLPSPALFGRAVLGIGMVGNYAAADPVMVGWLEEAIAAIGEADGGLRAALLARFAEEVLRSGSGRRAEALIDESIEVARRINDPSTLVQALYVKLHASRGPGQAQMRAELGEELLSYAEQRGLRHWLLRIRYHRAATFVELGRIADFYDEIEAIRRIPQGLRLGTEGLSFTEIDDIVGTVCALIEGRIADAEALATRAFSSASRRPNNTAMQIYSVQIAAARREQGRLAEFEPLVRVAAASAPSNAFARALLAFCGTELGHPQQAAAELRRLVHGLGPLPNDFLWLATVAYLAEACSAVGDAAVAKVLYDALKPYEERHIVIGCISYLGPAHYYLGLLATALPDFDAARRHFESALKACDDFGARGWGARAQCRLARLTLTQGGADREHQLALLQDAVNEAIELDLKSLRDFAESAIAEFGGQERPALAPAQAAAPRKRVLATVLFVDIVGSTMRAAKLGDKQWGELLDSFYAHARRAIENFRGRQIATLGDGNLAIFDQPSDALGAAFEMRAAIVGLGLEIRSGAHSGEIDFVGEDIRGLAVHIGSRIASSAGSGEVIVSNTVRELTLGQAFGMEDRGLHILRGVPGEWRLFAAEPQSVAVV